MNALLIFLGIILFCTGILWMIARAIGWKLVFALIGADIILRRFSRSLKREHVGEDNPFSDDLTLAKLWHAETRRSRLRNRRRSF